MSSKELKKCFFRHFFFKATILANYRVGKEQGRVIRVCHFFWNVKKFQRWPAFLILLGQETCCKRAEPALMSPKITIVSLQNFHRYMLTNILFQLINLLSNINCQFCVPLFVLFNIAFMTRVRNPANYARNWWFWPNVLSFFLSIYCLSKI